MKIVTVPQGSPEWHRARAGVITASMFHIARQRLKTGPEAGDYTAAAKAYAFRLAIERISGEPLDEGFETYQMRRGHELEPDARLAHEARIEMLIEHAGVVLTDDGLFGASADGLIDDDGGSEYKCLVAPERIRSIVVDQDLSEYHDQVQGCMWLTGRKWWHFVLYCPALKPAGLDLIIHEQKRDDDYIEALEQDLIQFNQEVERCREAIVERGATQKAFPLPHPAGRSVASPATARGIFGDL